LKAELAFCNDVDFGSWETYREVHRTLSDLGLPAEDSFWLFDPEGSDLALFRGSVQEKGPRHEEILEEIAEGRLTVLHGGGNWRDPADAKRDRRRLISEGIAYLREHVRVPEIWTNHGDETDVQNVGGGAPTYQRGDDPASGAFVLDLLLGAGVRWFWTDHHYRHDFVSTRGEGGAHPALVWDPTRSGQRIRCFYRYRGDLPFAPDAQSLAWQLREENLLELVEAGGVSIVYQHWMVHRDARGRPRTASLPVFSNEAVTRLTRLAELQAEGSLAVRPLSELLRSLEQTTGSG